MTEIKLQFSDNIKEYSIDKLKIFPTICDIIDLGSLIEDNTVNTAIPIHGDFLTSDMDSLLNLIDNYKEIFDVDEYYKNIRDKGSADKYVNVNYKIIILSEYLGYNLFEVKVNEKLFNLNMPNYKQDKSIKTFNNGWSRKITYNNFTIVVVDKHHSKHGDKPENNIEGILLASYLNKGICVHIKNCVIPDHDDCYVHLSNVKEYFSRIKINFDDLNWNLIEKYYNSDAIKPYISKFCKKVDKKYIKMIPDDQKQSLINILDKVGYYSFSIENTEIEKTYECDEDRRCGWGTMIWY